MAHPAEPAHPNMRSGLSAGSRAAAKAAGDRMPPKVTNVVPAIFVPLDKDITQPFEVPRGRIEVAKARLDSIEFHRQGVKEGMKYLAELDSNRILKQAARWEAENGVPHNPPGLHPDDTDALIDNMRAPAIPGVNYNMATQDLRPAFIAAVDTADRTDTVRQLQHGMEVALNHIAGYDAHMDAIKKRWADSLEKEERMMEARFGPTTGQDGPEKHDIDGDVVMR